MEEFEYEGVAYVSDQPAYEGAKGSDACTGCAFEKTVHAVCTKSFEVRRCWDFPPIIWIKKEQA